MKVSRTILIVGWAIALKPRVNRNDLYRIPRTYILATSRLLCATKIEILQPTRVYALLRWIET